ncbi:MAG: hypothetical protein MI923_03095 [Phycisphaerales bacterium]|nr:hypothetical protein [Phycisphaerales bacterium]
MDNEEQEAEQNCDVDAAAVDSRAAGSANENGTRRMQPGVVAAFKPGGCFLPYP